MTAPIITPALVRRYLLATGWTVEQIGDRLAWTRPDGSACWSSLDAVPAMLNAAPPLRADEYGARLGMLAAAEKLRVAFESNWAPGEGGSVERFVRGEIRGYILAAGLTQEAWEEARGR